MQPQRNLKFEHVFAVVRFDRHMAERFGFDPEQISVKVIVRTEEEADREVERLNALNAEKGAAYFWRLTRIPRDSAIEASHAPVGSAGSSANPSRVP